MALFDRITIIGLGLIGGSLGMAIKRKRLAKRVVGCSRKPSTIQRAKRLGAIDEGTTRLAEAVAGAEMVIVATPVDDIVQVVRRAARAAMRGAVITDVGSTKAKIVHELERGLPQHAAFVGGHPIAGSEKRGIEAARANIFDGSLCILTATARTPREALQSVRRLWAPLVRQVIVMEPAAHDELLGQASHLPHLVAFALASAVTRDAAALTPRSLLEMTRLAASDPDLWDDILLSNRQAIVKAMSRFDREWTRLRIALERGDRAALRRHMAAAQRSRHHMTHA